MLRIGRINSRALDGPVRLSCDNREILGEIQEKYQAWYKVWCEVYVPKLMTIKKGFKTDRDLAVDDLVYYQKKESELSSPWQMGRVDQVIRGRDGIIRRAIIKFKNAKENFYRVTDRSVRRLIRLYSVDDPDLHQDFKKIQDRIDELTGQEPGLVALGLFETLVPGLGAAEAELVTFSNSPVFQANADSVSTPRSMMPSYPDVTSASRCQCCCQSHCEVSIHNCYGTRSLQHSFPMINCDLEGSGNLGLTYELDDVILEDPDQDAHEPDSITALIMSVGQSME